MHINAKGRKIYPTVQVSFRGKLTLWGSRSFIQLALFDLDIEAMGGGDGERRKDAARGKTPPD